MGKYFGTDGFRGEAGRALTADHAFAVGRFIGYYFGGRKGNHARILIGKDTRLSSYMLEYALAAGCVSSGADAYIMHVTTTPSIAFIARTDNFDCGVMISASHNPFYDNGIKLIGAGGMKMGEDITDKIEEYIDKRLSGSSDELPRVSGDRIGRVVDYVSGRNRYTGYLISLASNSYKSLKIGLDCANGSAWMIAKAVFDALGAKTYAIGNEPDGTNINRSCGSTHIEALKALVVSNGLDVGFAFDGDADRCIAVDSCGNEVDGDKILFVLARSLSKSGGLDGNKIVTTVMSNLGLYRALDKIGIGYEITSVGDRFVYECMSENGYKLGGEQSGHIIIQKYASTGDGILTAILLCEEMIERNKTLAELCSDVVLFPQITKSIRVNNKEAVINDGDIAAAVREISDELGAEGRVLFRKSGTEDVVRITVECGSGKTCLALIERLEKCILRRGYVVGK